MNVHSGRTHCDLTRSLVQRVPQRPSTVYRGRRSSIADSSTCRTANQNVQRFKKRGNSCRNKPRTQPPSLVCRQYCSKLSFHRLPLSWRSSSCPVRHSRRTCQESSTLTSPKTLKWDCIFHRGPLYRNVFLNSNLATPSPHGPAFRILPLKAETK